MQSLQLFTLSSSVLLCVLALQQVLFCDIQLALENRGTDTQRAVQTRTVSIGVRLTGTSLSSLVMSTSDSEEVEIIIDDSLRTVATELDFGVNSTVSEPFPLFLVLGVPFRLYNISLTIYDESSRDQELTISDFSTASLRVHTLDQSFTIFEIVFKYVLLSATLVMLLFPRCGFGFCWKVFQLPPGMRSSEQVWLLSLSTALVFFNEPFVALKVLNRAI